MSASWALGLSSSCRLLVMICSESCFYRSKGLSYQEPAWQAGAAYLPFDVCFHLSRRDFAHIDVLDFDPLSTFGILVFHAVFKSSNA